jgi:hypothetical protein
MCHVFSGPGLGFHRKRATILPWRVTYSLQSVSRSHCSTHLKQPDGKGEDDADRAQRIGVQANGNVVVLCQQTDFLVHDTFDAGHVDVGQTDLRAAEGRSEAIRATHVAVPHAVTFVLTGTRSPSNFSASHFTSAALAVATGVCASRPCSNHMSCCVPPTLAMLSPQ